MTVVIEQGWQPIETAPPENELILLFGPEYFMGVSLFCGSHASLEHLNAPHWRPLHAPPK